MRTLHDLIYSIIEDICYDREYLYSSYIMAFNELSSAIYGNGSTETNGTLRVNGLKSDYDAHFEWELERRLDFLGSNVLSLTCQIKNRFTGQIERQLFLRFDVATGNEIGFKTGG